MFLVIVCSTQFASGQQYVSLTTWNTIPEGLASATVSNREKTVGIPDTEFATITVSGVVVTQLLTSTSDASLTINLQPILQPESERMYGFSAPT